MRAALLLRSNFVCLCFLISLQNVLPAEDSTGAFWDELGRREIEASLAGEKNDGVAKNIILFVGDGMGMSTITAGRIFKGQLAGHRGEEGFLSFEKFSNVGLLKTYNVDRQVPDSAGTATALFTGIKANYYTVGFDATVTFNVCRTDVEERARVEGLISWGIEAGKSTGIVTTTRVTHATPAASYAHSANRDWECDTKIPPAEKQNGCIDISRQLVENKPGKNINVIFGGGEQTLRPPGEIHKNDSTLCFRGDGADLIWDWMQYQKNQKRNFSYVSDKKSLFAMDGAVDYVLGIFGPGNLPYDKDRTVEPSLEEMTTKAIQILSRNSNGYVLIVCRGQLDLSFDYIQKIDHAHHYNLAEIAMEEVIAFDNAIAKAITMTNPKETLIVVTADHSHAFTMNGYPTRGNPITGLGDTTPEGYRYQTLSYINGPGYSLHRQPPPTNVKNQTSTVNTWRNLTSTVLNRTTPHMAGYWMEYETHGGEDVPVYASGPMAHLFHGVHEQTHVAYSIAYSACIGPYSKVCRESGVKPPSSKCSRTGMEGGRMEMLLPFALLPIFIAFR